MACKPNNTHRLHC